MQLTKAVNKIFQKKSVKKNHRKTFNLVPSSTQLLSLNCLLYVWKYEGQWFGSFFLSDVLVISTLSLLFFSITKHQNPIKHKTLKIRIPGNRSKVEPPYSVSQILRHIKCPNANRVTRMKGGKRHGSERPRKNRAHRHCADSLAQIFDYLVVVLEFFSLEQKIKIDRFLFSFNY